jgi:hypothetical protein
MGVDALTEGLLMRAARPDALASLRNAAAEQLLEAAERRALLG